MKTIILSERDLELLNYFLDQLDNYLGNEGCNDLGGEIEAMFSEEEGEQVAKEFAKINNPADPNGPDWPLFDGCLLAWLQHKINNSQELK